MVAADRRQNDLASAENLLIASNFYEASKAAERVLVHLYSKDAGLDARIRAWYVLIQAHYMQKDLLPLHRFLLQHHLPIQILPPRVILLWALVHLELGDTARARDDLSHWLIYAVLASAANPDQNNAALNTSNSVPPNLPEPLSQMVTRDESADADLISDSSWKSQSEVVEASSGGLMEEIISTIPAPSTPEGFDMRGCVSECLPSKHRQPECGTGGTDPVTSRPQVKSKSDGDFLLKRNKGSAFVKEVCVCITAPESWELTGDDALALARLFAVEIMGRARAEFSAARRWLQSEVEILSVSQVQLLLQELETAELVKIQEEELLTQHASQQAEALESPESVPPLLNPQLRQRWRGGGGGGPSSTFLTMTGDMDELAPPGDWPTTPAPDTSSKTHRVKFGINSPATHNTSSPASPSGSSYGLTRGAGWLHLLWKKVMKRVGNLHPPRVVFLLLCCVLFGLALHSERASIKHAASFLSQRVRMAVMDAVGMGLALNPSPIATAAAHAGMRASPGHIPVPAARRR